MDFVHLHLSDHYSFLQALGKTEEFVLKANECGHKAIAQTNFGNMMGALKLVKACKKYDIKPILGLEIEIVDKAEFKGSDDSEKNTLIMLAKNEAGYKTIVKLLSKANIDFYYYNPRLDWKTIKEYNDGNILFLHSGIRNSLAQAVLRKVDLAERVKFLRDTLGDFVVGFMATNLPGMSLINSELFKLYKKEKFKFCATVGVMYPNKEDYVSHQVLRRIDRPNDVVGAQDFWYMTKDEVFNAMKANHPELPEKFINVAIENTVRIADKIEMVEFKGRSVNESIPTFDAGKDPFEFLKGLVKKGFKTRNIIKDREAYVERAKFELSQINEYGLINYMLIVWDFMQFAKRVKIITGPARGSCASSLIAYLIEITQVDPIKYNLAFDNFISPHRFASQYSFSFKDYSFDKWKAEKLAQ